MPELPDVETERRYLDATALHQTIEAVEIDAPKMVEGCTDREVQRALDGRQLETTARHGKVLFAKAGPSTWLVLHFGMTGTLDYAKGDDVPDGARLVLRFDNGYRLAAVWRRRLGRIALTETPTTFVAQHSLGPDALDADLDPEALGRMLDGRRGGLKSALMDQSFIAGLGNVYSDEILFQAGLAPDRAAQGLAETERRGLSRAIHHVLTLAIERQAEPARLPDSWLLPRRRADAMCPKCGETIQTRKVAGRTAYVCPRCQH